MNAKNAQALLSLVQHYSVATLLEAGALEGVVELVALSNVQPEEGIYLIVPHTVEHGLRKVDAIKTLRVVYDIGLKEAKDEFEKLMLTCTDRPGGAVRLGPLNPCVAYRTMTQRLNGYVHREDLLQLVKL